jgi:hypothetical protein
MCPRLHVAPRAPSEALDPDQQGPAPLDVPLLLEISSDAHQVTQTPAGTAQLAWPWLP